MDFMTIEQAYFHGLAYGLLIRRGNCMYASTFAYYYAEMTSVLMKRLGGLIFKFGICILLCDRCR